MDAVYEDRPDRGRARYRVPAALVAAAVALLLVTGAYNNAAAPPATTKRFVDLIPLLEGSTASPASRIEIQGEMPLTSSHFVLDRATGLRYPIAGGGATPLAADLTTEAVADGDNLAWVNRSNGTSVNYFDHARGTVRSTPLAPDIEPLPGTLRAGDGTLAWSYLRADGTQAAAVLPPGASAPVRYASAFSENRTVAGVIRTDLFYSKTADGSDIWLFNSTQAREELLASAPGVSRLAMGAFFAAWVNGSSARIEYFDVLDRVVEHIAPPAEVTPKWVLANGLTILIGGTKQGFFFSSPRVELYDFSVGVAHIYDSIGVDFDTSPYFAYADGFVVSLVIEIQRRPAAPLTTPLLIVSVAVTALAGVAGIRGMLREEDDL